MEDITLEIDVAAPKDRVHRLALDFQNTPSLYPKIVGIEMLASPKDASGLAGVGTRWRETRRVGRGQSTLELEITERRGSESFVVSCVAMGARYDTRFQFSDGPSGRGSVVRLGVTVTPRGWFSGVMARLTRGAMSREMLADLESLKKAAESDGV